MKVLNRWACALLCVAMPLGAAQAQGAGGDAFDEFDESSVIGQGAESVEGASGLGDPFAPPAAPVPEAEPEGEPWRGPSVEFAYGTYFMADGHGAGRAHSFQFGGFIPVRWLRLGARAEFATLEYSLGQDDLVARGTVSLGYQQMEHLGPFVPYAAMVGTVGVVLGNRFHTPRSQVLRGMGFEVGGNLNLVQSLFVGLGVAYLRVTVDSFAYNLWVLRASIGL